MQKLRRINPKIDAEANGLFKFKSHELYGVWCGIKGRCQVKNSTGFSSYGGRGIKVCERWQKFENFLTDMGERPSPKHEIDRIDGNGDYQPENCRWVDAIEQCNNRSNNRFLTHDGKTKTLAQWAREYGLNSNLFRLRIRRNWTFEQAISGARIVAMLLFCTGLSFGESGKKSRELGASLVVQSTGFSRNPDGRPNRQHLTDGIHPWRNDQVRSGPRVVESSAVQNFQGASNSYAEFERKIPETCVRRKDAAGQSRSVLERASNALHPYTRIGEGHDAGGSSVLHSISKNVASPEGTMEYVLFDHGLQAPETQLGPLSIRQPISAAQTKRKKTK